MTLQAGPSPVATTERDDTRSFYFQWHILEQCNLQCKHCYQAEYTRGPMSLDCMFGVAEQMEAAMRQWRYKGRVSITGGEPLLDPKTVFSLLDFFARSPHFEWLGILTNGTRIDSALAQHLAKCGKLREVQVSLDGSNADVHDAVRGPGSFDEAVRGIAHLRNAGVKTAVMFTLTQQNVRSAPEIIDLALELGVDAVTVERATPIGPRCDAGTMIESHVLRDVYSAIAQKKRRLCQSPLQIRTSRPLWCLVGTDMGGFCPAGLSCLAILPDGTVLPCRRMEIPIGNIVTDGLYRIWYTSKVLWRLRDKRNLATGCGGCQWLWKCGGCRAIAYAVTGDFMGNDPQCWKCNPPLNEGSST